MYRRLCCESGVYKYTGEKLQVMYRYKEPHVLQALCLLCGLMHVDGVLR
jgi:hypothetical protein